MAEEWVREKEEDRKGGREGEMMEVCRKDEPG